MDEKSIRVINIPMICTCQDENRLKAADVRTEVIGRLSGGSAELQARTVTMDNFLDAIVVSLEWDHSAHITKIENDQWSAVTVEKNDGSLRLRVECDHVEDGLATIWKALDDGLPLVE